MARIWISDVRRIGGNTTRRESKTVPRKSENGYFCMEKIRLSQGLRQTRWSISMGKKRISPSCAISRCCQLDNGDHVSAAPTLAGKP